VLGLCTRFQAVPFQWRMSVRYAVLLSTYPAAHALPGEIWTTPCSLVEVCFWVRARHLGPRVTHAPEDQGLRATRVVAPDCP
jgi:hypothetical protein